MSMTRNEALEIAYGGEHATVSYDLAAAVIRETGKGRDNEAYARLADLRAAYQRLQRDIILASKAKE